MMYYDCKLQFKLFIYLFIFNKMSTHMGIMCN